MGEHNRIIALVVNRERVDVAEPRVRDTRHDRRPASVLQRVVRRGVHVWEEGAIRPSR